MFSTAIWCLFIAFGLLFWSYTLFQDTAWGVFCRKTYRSLAPYLSRDKSDAQLAENGLGMKFAPAGTTGVLFSVWLVRVEDFRAFAKATDFRSEAKEGRCSWEAPGFHQESNHPVVGVHWHDAANFCEWLTRTERAANRLGPFQFYRLPTDAEWSAAIALSEQNHLPPKDKDGKIRDIYPWGKEWPPPANSGNFADSAYSKAHPKEDSISNYRDGYVYTSPVGSFPPNCYGLFDMAGNVWELCDDWYSISSWLNAGDHSVPFEGYRTVRGGAWDTASPDELLSSARSLAGYDERSPRIGFRCVIVTPNRLKPHDL